MKVKNIFKIFALLFVMIISIGKVNADTITTKYSVSGIGSYLGTEYYDLATDDGTPLYCMNRGLDYTGGVQYTLESVITDPSNAYLCAVIKVGRANNGSLPYSTLQEALWDAENGNSAYTGCSFQQAQSAHCDTATVKSTYDTEKQLKQAGQNPNVDFSINSDTLTITTNGDYYVSKGISVNSSGTYTLDTSNLPTGSFISSKADCSGTPISTTTSSKTIYACIPSTSDFSRQSFTVKASISAEVVDTYEYDTVTVYNSRTCYNAGTAESASIKIYWREGVGSAGLTNQRLGLMSYTKPTGGGSYSDTPAESRTHKTTNITRTASDEDSITLTVPLGTIKLTKTDSRTKKPVEGAKFKLYKKVGTEYVEVTKDAKGNTIDIITGVDGTYTISNLVYGTYKLVEYEPATGYENNATEAKDIVIDSITTVPVNLTNTPISTLISKQDIANEKELPGAHIIVTNEYNEPILEFISGEDPKKFYLGPGKYTLVETAAPSGYDRVETVFEFEILDSGDIKLINPQDDRNIKTENNKIILYNTVVVDVPDTGKNSTIFYVIGLIMAITGSAIVLLTLRKQKVNKI